jgi:hypothetical protein
MTYKKHLQDMLQITKQHEEHGHICQIFKKK